jgi:hypothetical protein
VINTWALPDITDSVLSLFLIVVFIDSVNKFKLLVDVSILFNLPFCVTLVELNDEDKLPILELSPLVVVATDELKLSIDALILELNDVTLVEILELKVEYPVVPVINT